MLLSFSVSNFKSFREEQLLNLTADNLKPAFSWLENAAVSVGKEESALRVKAIYGANASGKSNLLEALRFMQTISLMSAGTPGLLTELESFRFDSSSPGSCSSFEVIIAVNKKKYRYGIRVDRSMFHEEWLYDETVRKAKIFTRTNQELSINKKYFNRPEELNVLIRGENKLFRKDSSFLSVLRLFDFSSAIQKVITFITSISIIGEIESDHIKQQAYRMLGNRIMRDKVTTLLNYAGVEPGKLIVIDREANESKDIPADLLAKLTVVPLRYSLASTYERC